MTRQGSGLALTLLMGVSLAAGLLIFAELVHSDRPPGWDEAVHSLRGVLIAHDIRSGDLSGLLWDTYRQVYWPPLHSWLVAAPFLVVEPSLEAARAMSVLAFVFFVPTLYLVARTLEPREGLLAGFLAAGFALTCPGIVALAAASLLELPALLGLSATMLVYCRLARHPAVRPEAHALLGVCVVVTYLAKTNYAVLLVICIVLTKLIDARFRVRPLLTRENLYAILPVALFCAVWFAWPSKIVSTWNALVNEPYGGDEGRGLAGLLFFPRAFVELTGSVSALLVAGIILAWRNRGDRGVRFLLVLVLTHFFIGELHHTKVDRHIVPMLPPMFVLAGVTGARLWHWLRLRGGAEGTGAFALLAIVAFLQIAYIGSGRGRTAVQTPSAPVTRSGAEVLEYISERARENGTFLVVDTYRPWPHPTVLDWHLLLQGLLPVTAADGVLDPPQHRRLAAALDGLRMPDGLRREARRVMNRYDAPSMARTLHSAGRRRENPNRFAANLEATIQTDPPQAIISFMGMSDTTHHIRFAVPVIARNGYREISVRDFPRAKARVYLYGRSSDSAAVHGRGRFRGVGADHGGGIPEKPEARGRTRP